MAVYTKVSKVGIQSILSKYNIGKLIKYEEIQEGIENSNFKVTTTDGTFILTIYEKRVKEEDLPYFINLMDHLSSNGINCPKPIKDKSGEIFQNISNKKSISFLEIKFTFEFQYLYNWISLLYFSFFS